MRRLRLILLALASVTAMTAAGGPAIAAAGGQVIRPAFASISLVVNSDHSRCIITHGQGVQVNISNGGGCGHFTSQQIQSNPILILIKDGNGNCLRAKTDQTVIIGNGACNPADTGAQWLVGTGSDGGPYRNIQDGANMVTKCDSNGCNVFAVSQAGTFNIVKGS